MYGVCKTLSGPTNAIVQQPTSNFRKDMEVDQLTEQFQTTKMWTIEKFIKILLFWIIEHHEPVFVPLLQLWMQITKAALHQNVSTVVVAQSVWPVIEMSLVRIPTEATIYGWTHTLRFVARYHLMSFIETNVVGTDMSQVRPACR